MQMAIVWLFLGFYLIKNGLGCSSGNRTLDPADTQLCDFKKRNPVPIGVLTTSAGRPIEIEEINALNSNLIANEHLVETTLHLPFEQIPSRVVHAKGFGSFGYFEVTDNVTMFTKADVFSKIGKKTPVFIRFSTELQDKGGPDVARETKGISIRFYTEEGNLDLLCLNIPVYVYADPLYFRSNIHARKRNPVTNSIDATATWDFLTARPTALHMALHVYSALGAPRSFRHMDAFPIHTFALNNRNGDECYGRFRFKTDQGIQNLSLAEFREASSDLEYYSKDLYNSIEKKDYPSWTLYLDIMLLDDIKNLDYNPFDVTRTWKNGTYRTVKVGRLVLDKNPDNQHKTSEVSAFKVGNLVPGIPGPVDGLFQARQLMYRAANLHRLGHNHNMASVNKPHSAKTYLRDGMIPLGSNMGDVPNYFPNSYNGPEPMVDTAWPRQGQKILTSNAVDLQPMADFYNIVLPDDFQRQILAEALAESLATVTDDTLSNVFRLFRLIDKDLSRRVRAALFK